MADRTLFDMQSISRGVVHIPGAFRPNGAGAIDNTLNKGHGWTVARTGVGVYRVTFEDVWVDWISIQAALSKAALADEYVRVAAIDVPNKIFDIFAHDGATPAALEIASDADTWVSFLAIMKNTSVTR